MRRCTLLVFLLLFQASAFAQGLRVVANNKPLGDVLNSLNVSISFDDKALSRYRVTLSQAFRDEEEAIRFLLRGKPFELSKVGQVFVISAEPRKKPKAKPADVATAKSDTCAAIKDTIVQLSELTVLPEAYSRILSTGAGYASGEMLFSLSDSRFLPGSIDDAVFALLRLMPGVRASGEPSDDILVWGSLAGENRLSLDGFTIYGMKAFNDQISAVNPYFAHDLRLHKGGADASHGDAIGAQAEVTGFHGDTARTSVKGCVSTFLANVFVSQPIGHKAVLSAGYRQTYYNLYNSTSTTTHSSGQGANIPTSIYITPHYKFKDFNAHLSGNFTSRTSYTVSLYGAWDSFRFDALSDAYQMDAREKTRQYGTSATVQQDWSADAQTRIVASYSDYDNRVDNLTGTGGGTPIKKSTIDNRLQNMRVKTEHTHRMGFNALLMGGTWQAYRNCLAGQRDVLSTYSLYATDKISLRSLVLNVGLRGDYTSDNKFCLQPRLSLRYDIGRCLTATASWGLYRQYLSRTPMLYDDGSYEMAWSIAPETRPSSMQAIAGVSFHKRGWLIGAEAYHKQNKGESFYFANSVEQHDNRIVGGDLSIKKSWTGGTVFASYSILNATQPIHHTAHEAKAGTLLKIKRLSLSAAYVFGTGYPYIATAGAMHNGQREAAKAGHHGGGNGQHGGNNGQQGNNGQHGGSYYGLANEQHNYNRLDLSAVYGFPLRQTRWAVGVSVLNVTAYRNVKYNYLLADKSCVVDVYAQATPFTPMLFLEIKW